jgi:hypothetical protein
MTFILSNLSNWLTDSQSSESSMGTETRNTEQSREWVAANAAGYTRDEATEADCTHFVDRRNSLDENAYDDLPGISKVVNSAIEWGGESCDSFVNLALECCETMLFTGYLISCCVAGTLWRV